MMEKTDCQRWTRGMRDSFFDSLYRQAQKDSQLILVTSDTGAMCHDEFRDKLNHQYINVGIAEQNLVGVAAGLSMVGKKTFIYAIIPFVTARCFEQIRVDVCCMELNVNVIGIGAGYDYFTLGPTHHGTEDLALMRTLPAMTIFSPCDTAMADAMAVECSQNPGPKYVRLDRIGLPLVYENGTPDLKAGMQEIKKGNDLCIIATGRMVAMALQVADKLAAENIDVGVVDLFRLKPLNKELIGDIISAYKQIATLEEHFMTGGLGSLVAEFMCDNGQQKPLKRFGIPDKYCREYGSREYLQSLNGIDSESVYNTLQDWGK